MKRQFLLVCLLVMLTLGGCMSLSVQQKIYRNGVYDLTLVLESEPEYRLVLSSLKSNLQVNDSVKPKLSYSETDTKVVYAFRGINPTTDKTLFVPKDTDGNPDLFSGGSVSQRADFDLLNPKHVQITKQFMFPYYIYTYTLLVDSPQHELASQPLGGESYVQDEAGILSPESFSYALARINEIYLNDSVEVIILTQPSMDTTNYYQFMDNFAATFPFKEEEPHYITIFLSGGPSGVCRVQTNMQLQLGIYTYINQLNTDFSEKCSQDFSSTLLKVVDDLTTYSTEHEIQDEERFSESAGDLFTIDYALQVFGSIVSTNGKKLDGQNVQFDVSLVSPGEYTVTFKDFFLVGLLGEFYGLYLLALLLVIVGAVVLVVRAKQKKKSPVSPSSSLFSSYTSLSQSLSSSLSSSSAM